MNTEIKSMLEKDYKELHNEYCDPADYNPLIYNRKIERIIAISDIHGDYDFTINILRDAKCINDKNKWIGGKTFVIIVGDILDSCRDNAGCINQKHEKTDLDLLDYLVNLSKEAKKVGGNVILLFGNHEIMNINKDFRYVSHNDMTNFAKSHKYKTRSEAFDKYYSRKLGCNLIPLVIINDILFIHGGINNHVIECLDIKNKNDLYKLGNCIKNWIFNPKNRSFISENIINHKKSIFWDRTMGNMDNDSCHLVNPILNILKIKKIVIGHTPQYEKGINSVCDDSIFKIDFAGSKGFEQFRKMKTPTGMLMDDNGQTNIEYVEILTSGDNVKFNIIKK